MKTSIFTLALAGLSFTAAATAQDHSKSSLRILYVGGTPDFDTYGTAAPDSVRMEEGVRKRMASFESFLNDYFTETTVIHAREYHQRLSYEYDVTILDGRPEPIVPGVTDQEKGIYLPPGYFTEDFDRPVLTIGEIGDRTGRRIGIKNDWYCLCLDAEAHHWRQEHPIFNGPFAVSMTVRMKPTPQEAFHYPYYHDGPIPEEIPMWTVQTTGYATEKGFRIGMVSRSWGYEDSPEAEYISSGVCQKTLDAVAIGRHGNFFHWGFSASPAYLTDEAKPVLANAIVYISEFAGQTPIARKYNDRTATREYLKELRHLLS
ncbi:MAG: hypothetical protein LUD68_04340, partial [Rikenellaceae bacterium]|nr:hypothetical protein [Rikenellaceae bacterium]